MLNTLPAATAIVASVGEYPQVMNILSRNGQIARAGDDRCHAGRAEVGDHPAAHGQARDERMR